MIQRADRRYFTGLLNLVPYIGNIPLAKLRPAHVSELVATLRIRGGLAGCPLPPKTTKHAFALLKGALAWAVRQELAARNVADAVSPPSVPRRELAALSVEEAQAPVSGGGRSAMGWGRSCASRLQPARVAASFSRSAGRT